MDHPASKLVRARLRAHLWSTPLVVLPLCWFSRRTPLALELVAGGGLAYYVGVGLLYAWALRRPDRALGAGADAPASRLERALGLATIGLGLTTVLIAFWGVGDWDVSTPARAAALASSFRIRMVAGLAIAGLLVAVIWFRARHRPRRVELFGQAGLGVALTLVGLTTTAASEKMVGVLARLEGPSPRVVGLEGWRTSPPRLAAATELVSEDGSQILFALRLPLERNRGCAPMKDMEPARFNREAQVERRHALPDSHGIECREAAVLVASAGQEQVEVGLRRCSDADGYLFAYRWTGDRRLPPEELQGHLGCGR